LRQASTAGQRAEVDAEEAEALDQLAPMMAMFMMSLLLLGWECVGSGGEAAIHQQFAAGDEGRFRAGQVGHGRCDVRCDVRAAAVALHGDAELDGVAMRSATTGRVRPRLMRNAAGKEELAEQRPRITLSDPDGVSQAVLMGLGGGLSAMPNVLPQLESGALVRLLPDWYADAGPISLYFASQKLLPAKTRAFVDFVIEQFRAQQLAQRFLATAGAPA
jgi:DNA-binding transcriptional LysR family regulator